MLGGYYEWAQIMILWVEMLLVRRCLREDLAGLLGFGISCSGKKDDSGGLLLSKAERRVKFWFWIVDMLLWQGSWVA